MRRDHVELGLSADLALAWHESGHAVAASALSRLTRVQIKSFPRAYFDRAGINQNDDLCIAAMGPAAQIAYMALHQTREPSSGFLDHWIYYAATKDLNKLSQCWPTMVLREDEWHARIDSFFRFLQQNHQISDVLELCAKTLLKKRLLSAKAVDNLVRDERKLILRAFSKVA
jgi:hypothetical protein